MNPTMFYPTDRASLERACILTPMRASGPGGQRRNKVETGIRLVHRSSGITVIATEQRSQYANREMAFARMAARLHRLQHRPVPRVPTRPSIASHERRLQEKRHIGQRKQQRRAAFPPEA